jgi:hypothetical protein
MGAPMGAADEGLMKKDSVWLQPFEDSGWQATQRTQPNR